LIFSVKTTLNPKKKLELAHECYVRSDEELFTDEHFDILTS